MIAKVLKLTFILLTLSAFYAFAAEDKKVATTPKQPETQNKTKEIKASEKEEVTTEKKKYGIFFKAGLQLGKTTNLQGNHENFNAIDWSFSKGAHADAGYVFNKYVSAVLGFDYVSSRLNDDALNCKGVGDIKSFELGAVIYPVRFDKIAVITDVRVYYALTTVHRGPKAGTTEDYNAHYLYGKGYAFGAGAEYLFRNDIFIYGTLNYRGIRYDRWSDSKMYNKLPLLPDKLSQQSYQILFGTGRFF
jgi:hypothetical protein